MTAPVLAPLDAATLREPSGASPVSNPWTSEQLTQLVVANVIGLAIALAGIFETTGDDIVRTRLSWLEVSVLGLIIAGVANGLWLIRTRRTLALARAVVLDPAHRTCLHGTPVEAPARYTLVAGDGMSRYHLPTCHLVAGKAVTARSRAQHERLDLAPCEVCRP